MFHRYIQENCYKFRDAEKQLENLPIEVILTAGNKTGPRGRRLLLGQMEDFWQPMLPVWHLQRRRLRLGRALQQQLRTRCSMYRSTLFAWANSSLEQIIASASASHACCLRSQASCRRQSRRGCAPSSLRAVRRRASPVSWAWKILGSTFSEIASQFAAPFLSSENQCREQSIYGA